MSGKSDAYWKSDKDMMHDLLFTLASVMNVGKPQEHVTITQNMVIIP
jgi:hypothetical protein